MENVLEPNVSFTFQFEEDFKRKDALQYMNNYWHHSMYYSAVYALVVYFGRQYMSDKEPFHLRTPLMVWSACLSVFSILGAIRMTPRLFYLISNYGVYTTICNTGFLYKPPCNFWAYIFAVSKLYELGDTMFIILRKQKLTFLHWYHHITVFCYCWYSYQLGDSSTGLVFCVMNFLVHSLMYTYYTLKAMKIPVPRQISMVITACQILQMVVGVTVTILAYKYKNNGIPCSEKYELIYLAMAMYASYLVLFANFFYQSYIARGRSKPMTMTEHMNGSSSSNGFTGKKDR